MEKKRYIEIEPYNVLDAIKDGKEVMCIDRDDQSVTNINNLSVSGWVSFREEIEESNNEKGYEYKELPRFSLWYAEKVEEPEVNDIDTVSDVSSSERTV